MEARKLMCFSNRKRQNANGSRASAYKQSDVLQHQVDGLTADVRKKDGSNEETFRR